MKNMDKKEKRKYLKRYRCVGGFILFVTIFTNIFTGALNGFIIITNALFGEGNISNFISELCTYGGICYSYYIGYRIFFKKYLKDTNLMKSDKEIKIINCIKDIIISFILVRFCWIVWSYIISLTPYNPENMDIELHLIGILYVIVIAPLIEELVFRGFILNTLKPYGTLVSFIISSITFGIFHGTVMQSIPAIFIGFILSYLAIKYKSLIPGIIVHLVSNGLSILEDVIPSNEILMNILIVIVVVLSVTVLIYLLIINYKNIKEYFKSLLNSFKLMYHSISYIVFLIFYILLIVLDYLDGTFHIFGDII